MIARPDKWVIKGRYSGMTLIELSHAQHSHPLFYACGSLDI